MKRDKTPEEFEDEQLEIVGWFILLAVVGVIALVFAS